MKNIRYTGDADIRVLTTQDLEAIGVGSSEDLMAHRGHFLQMNNAKAEALLKALPDEFEEVTEAEIWQLAEEEAKKEQLDGNSDSQPSEDGGSQA